MSDCARRDFKMLRKFAMGLVERHKPLPTRLDVVETKIKKEERITRLQARALAKEEVKARKLKAINNARDAFFSKPRCISRSELR